ncbi:class I adenylate-forming enzyme family protein [Ornithinimicrobium sp. W1679]|uniref:class I adenylate-forming enzyme family protein n=1 Tax=Ornithinimicrobium sp. W1679 TaxID=3418770 RepID=UPI003CE8846C
MRPWEAHYPAGLTAQAPPTPADLTTAWRERVERDPDGLALLHLGRAVTAAELDAQAEAFAALLASRGIGAGDRVGIVLQNVPTVAVVLLGAWRLGAVVPLLNPMYHGTELRTLIQTCGARALVVDPDLLGTVRSAAEGTTVEVIWADGDPELSSRRDARVDPALQSTDDVALLTFTSGTTGVPKAAMNTHGNVLTVAACVRDWMGLTTQDRVLCVAPVFHITGAVITLMAPLLAGAAVVLIGRTTPEGVLRAFREDGVTTTTGSITVFNGLARLEGIGPDDLPTVRHLYSGGAPVPPSTVERFRRELGVYIHNIYGMTETTSACIGVPPGGEAPVHEPTGSLAVGLPFPGLEVRVVDPEGHPVPAGAPGELELRGPHVVPGYWEDEQATAATFPGGALRTGDGAVLDEQGWVYIVDRLKDQINTSGYKVWPREVEEALLRHPAVHEAAVVGVPDDYRGEAVTAFVTSVAGAAVTEDELRAHARAELAAYKVPRRIGFLDELPKTPTGKIRRRDLRDGLDEEDSQV